MNQSSTILLTGATGLIGRILAKELNDAGHDVIAISRDKKSLDAAFAGSEAAVNGGRIIPLVADLSQATARDSILNFLEERSLRPDGFVHCARNSEFLKQDDKGSVARADWLGEFELDVIVASELTTALANDSRSQLKSVVIVSSMYGLTPPKPTMYLRASDIPPIHYGVCKAAQLHLARELGVRLASRGVRVNTVSYGGVRGRADAAFEARYATQCPAGKMLDSAELAGPILYLLSARSSATTGHNLLAEGGWTVW